MLLRLLLRRPLPRRLLTLASSDHHLASHCSLPPSRSPFSFLCLPPSSLLLQSLRTYSTHRGGGDDGGEWKFTTETSEVDSIFGHDEANLAGMAEGAEGDPFGSEAAADDGGVDVMSGEFGSKKGSGAVGVDWETAEGGKAWTLGDDDAEKGVSLFEDGDEGEQLGLEEFHDGAIEEFDDSAEEQKKLEKREEELLSVLKGSNRAFGDLIAASGITDDMIESLILLKDGRGVMGLHPLSELEDEAKAKLDAPTSRGEIERKKQEEITQARVRQVDEKGRAYGTGRRKCSVARVWIQPGEGKFIVNDKQFDAYFPILDHRADLLRPFTVTNTLGLWDVKCTVKGGGVSGQVGAIRLGISRALQNWEPGFRPFLKAVGFMTRDPRVVERKKPGKAKARKSFQWAKR